MVPENSIVSVTGNDRMHGRTLIRTSVSTTSGNTYRIGALVKYRCERGYKVLGESLSTCEDNGKWSGVTPKCQCKIFLCILRKQYKQKNLHTWYLLIATIWHGIFEGPYYSSKTNFQSESAEFMKCVKVIPFQDRQNFHSKKKGITAGY